MLAGMGKRDSDLETDAELWARVARSARPLRRGTTAAPATAPKPRAKAAPKESSPGAKPAPKPRAKAAPKESSPGAKPAPKPVAKPIAARGEALDRQTARQLEKGKLPVEARLDLHGMRQRDAHAALRKFLKWAQSKDYRHVLVITGKGAEPDDSRPFYEADERGVLRQAVPHWLSQPDLAHVVVSYSEAPRRLGGEGALYVRLRKLREG
jgi:DNA-nicking Smr family endonuclease